MEIIVLDSCQKELSKFPKEILKDILAIVDKLDKGYRLSMPIVRATPSVGKNISEIRLRDKKGAYRVFYYLSKKEAIYIVHAFKKKSQKTPRRNIELIRKRIQKFL